MQLNVKKNPNPKMRRFKLTFLPSRHTDGQKEHEKMYNKAIREMEIKTIMNYQWLE